MDLVRKLNRESSSPEPKKESRLTSIIDQLLSNRKTKDPISSEEVGKTKPPNSGVIQKVAAEPGERQQPPVAEPWPGARDGLLTGSPEGGARQGQQPARGGQLATRSGRAMPADALAPSSKLESPHPAKASEGEAESSSPSVSPHSPSPARGFPSLGFARAPFSPPPSLERCSPGHLPAGAPAIKQMEMMTRNYSDFMRSLAAKYNNQNSGQDSFSLSQTNGLIRGFDTPFPYKTGSPFLVRNMDVEGNGSGGCLGSTLNRKLDNQNPSTPVESRNTNNPNSSIMGVGIGPCAVADFSSSQTLLNLVRTASAQSASQLENYLKGAVKRTPEGESRLDPLDLSVAHAKRAKLDSSSRELQDFRDLLQAESEAGDCSLRTSSGGHAKPAWMSLLDRRIQASPTSSCRTSPKSSALAERQLPRCQSLCTEKSCSAQSDANDVAHWTVEEVVKFVTSVESCSEYAEKFRDQSIDGSTLPLLTEEHLTLYLGMKLGPALKLRSTLAGRIGHCAVCMHCIHCHGEDSADSRRHDSSRSPSISK